jgi:hypothetical protein
MKMTEQLPIIININYELLEKFSKIEVVCNKLEAQFNFQTLTANWYGNEESILTIQLMLETPASFIKRNNELQSFICNSISVTSFSDDVVCSMNDIKHQLYCYIAMTSAELDLLELQPKLLTSLIQVKLYKVLSLIAEQESLTKISCL